ncbi:MAG TPA: sigma-70 family RNA polymerase sigma factor, partial [Polyangiaceae bacterium]|nr:sigma-70 family RNA polymerase sigma factor [Polyangiaceae bacterium]
MELCATHRGPVTMPLPPHRAPRFVFHLMATPTEAELLESAQGGDSRAFSRLVKMHQRRIYACAVGMLGDGGDADDAVQETFVRAWRAIARFDGRSKLSTWLYRVCVNVCLNHIRKRKRHEAADIA